MKRIAIGSLLVSSLVLACASAPSTSIPQAALPPLRPSRPQGQPVSVVPARSAAAQALGVAGWELYITSTGITTYGVATDGRVLTEQRTRRQANAAGVSYQESRAFYPYPAAAVMDMQGNVLKNTFPKSKSATYALYGASEDIAAVTNVPYDSCGPTALQTVGTCGAVLLSDGAAAALAGIGCLGSLGAVQNDCSTEIQQAKDAATTPDPTNGGTVDCRVGPPSTDDPGYNEYCYNCGCPQSNNTPVAPNDPVVASNPSSGSDPTTPSPDPSPSDPSSDPSSSGDDTTSASAGDLGEGDCCDDSGDFCGCSDG